MVKRLFDIGVSLVAMVVLSPILLVAAAGIWIFSGRPILYRAARAGRESKPFVMHKFRTMRVAAAGSSSAITACRDDRVFAFGSLLRRLKIDELPQLYDVLRGAMSIVGPRPEDAQIARRYFAPEHWQTLAVRPGLASPGSIYNYTHGEKLLGSEAPQQDYLEKLLPVKLALELVYVRRASLWYDLRLIGRTVGVILLIALGKRNFPNPPEMREIDRIVPARKAPPAVREESAEKGDRHRGGNVN